MAGWVAFVGEIIDFDVRLRRFKKIFSLENFPDLRVEEHVFCPQFRTLCWNWNKREMPDIFQSTNKNKVIFLSGIITECRDVDAFVVPQAKVLDMIAKNLMPGAELVTNKLNGSFSIVAYDDDSRIAEVYTDRFASRSVWIGHDNSVWIIGNFPSAIAAFMSSEPKLDPAGLWSFFHAGRQVGNHSLYSNVRALMAGQKAILSPGSEARISYWWQRKYKPEKNMSPREWGSRLAHAIERSGNRYKKVSRKSYLFLSGGLDSRIVAAAFREPLKTLTIITNPNAESRIAWCISRILGLEHETIIRSPYWYLENTKASSLISSGVYLNHHAHFITPLKIVSSEEPEAVFLLGDLMENFNKHYFSMPSHYSLIFSPENISNILFSFVPYTTKNYGKKCGRLFNKKIRDVLEEQYLSFLKEFAISVMDVSENHEDRLDTFLRWSNVGITPTYNMITCIWPFAGERNIYFDNDLDDISLRIPSNLRKKSFLHNWILYYLNKILLMIPDANSFLPPAIPKLFADYSKKIRPSLGKIRRSHLRSKKNLTLRTSGSWLLLHEMYRKDKLYRNQIEKLIYNHDVFSPDLFNLDEIMQVWREYLEGKIEHHFEIEALRSFGCLNEMIPAGGIAL